ncbi:hypothetical protein D9M68_788990 [compost metagenome]
MFRCQYHEVYPENRIRSGRKYFDLCIALVYAECDLRTFTLTDPVALHFLHCLTPFQFIQAVQQVICIRSNTQEPLTHFTFFNRVATAFRYTIDYFIIGQNRCQGFTPPYFSMVEIRKAVLHQYIALNGLII